jgi:hypothetical protein
MGVHFKHARCLLVAGFGCFPQPFVPLVRLSPKAEQEAELVSGVGAAHFGRPAIPILGRA